MKLVDSCGWLEFFTDGPLADDYADHLADLSEIITPTIVLHDADSIVRPRSDAK